MTINQLHIYMYDSFKWIANTSEEIQDSKNISKLQVYFLWPMHSAEGIKCVEVFLFLEVGLMEIKSFWINLFCMWKGHHHVINDVVLLGQGGSFPAHWKRHCLLGTDNWIVGHIIDFCIDIFLLISTPKTLNTLFW